MVTHLFWFGGMVSTLGDSLLRFPNLYIDTSAYVPSRYPKALVEYMRGRGAKRVTESLFQIPRGREKWCAGKSFIFT